MEALGAFKKVQALAAIAYNIRLLNRIPSKIKETLQSMKDEMNELQVTFNKIKTNGDAF